MPYTKKLWEDKIVDGGGTVIQAGTPVSAGNLNRMEQGIADAHAALEGANRQVQTIGQGVTVLNAAMDAPVNIEVEGRTLTSLGNSNLESTKYHVLSAKRTKIKMPQSGNTYQGVAKFTSENGVPQVTRIANFEEKVTGSTLENPHISKASIASTVLSAPNLVTTESSQSSYTLLNQLDGTVVAVAASGSGTIAQRLFSFDLIAEIERHVGTIPRADVAGKVQWLKDNVLTLKGSWHGFGSSVGGNKASWTFWNNSTTAWFPTPQTHSLATVSKLSLHLSGATVINMIGSDGIVHYLAYAEASDGVMASTLNTDYIDFEIELKAGADFREPSIPLYEVDAADYAKILVDWNEGEVRRRYPAAKGTQHLNGLVIIAEGDNLLPPLSEWLLHANAVVKGSYDLELNATSSSSRSTIDIPVVKGQAYTINDANGNASFYFQVLEGASIIAQTTAARSVTFTPTTNVITVRTNNNTAGTFVYSNPMLTLGSVAKPFSPRNPSMLLAPTKLGVIGDKKDLLFKQDGVWKRRKMIEKDIEVGNNLIFSATVVDYEGYKLVSVQSVLSLLPTPATPISNALATKYNGKLLKSQPNFTTVGADEITFDNGSAQKTFRFTLSDTDTGFGETYTPIPDEIRAYFNGWKVKTANATTFKPESWMSIVDGTDAPTQTIDYVRVNKAPMYTPYKLSYVLATPAIETINVEGDIVANGPTQVEVTSGVIVREKATPFLILGAYRIADAVAGRESSRLKYDNEKIIGVYKNGQLDSRWIMQAASPQGKQRPTLIESEFDPTAEYTVTYIPFDRRLLTINPLDVDASYAQNVRSAVDDLVAKSGDTATTVSIHATLLYDVLKRLKAGGL
ncbi:hypothetical protein AWH48_11620 [Domibacillus aminovorans]|uniref:Uncharacterized protein n=1 Tax=Domibacillus aminovorans TaxID=29332 RepID=A0A177KKH9_9BACI|nr:hypothetical protein [Domibacillus aminovorans]OAH53910.1 hypothetical protein AWH48_11620 [Domibacillus aminovorans]